MTTITPTSVQAEASSGIQRVSKSGLIIRRFCRNKMAVVGVVLFLLLCALAVVGPYIAKWGYTELDFLSLSEPPSSEHWFGTGQAGGDMFALTVHGLGRSIMIGLMVSLGTTIIAALVGAALAYVGSVSKKGGVTEKVGIWIVDMLLVVPTFLLLALVSASASGTSGWLLLVLALTLFGWFLPARVFRAVAQSVREREYITAARYMGVRWWTILRRHLIPNLGAVLIINTVLGVIIAIEAETSLSFIGFGIQPPDTSLGVLIEEGSKNMLTAWWILVFPLALLLLLLLSMLWINNGLEDALNPSSGAGGKA